MTARSRLRSLQSSNTGMPCGLGRHIYGACLLFPQHLSLTAGAIEVQKELSSKTGLELPATFMFDYPSISEMQSFILSALPMQSLELTEQTWNTEVQRGEFGCIDISRTCSSSVCFQEHALTRSCQLVLQLPNLNSNSNESRADRAICPERCRSC